MGYYIYKYIENNEVVYIGQTTNLDQRIKDHTIDKLANFKGQIYYFECPNKTSMRSWEYFLINKYHPKYNIALNNPEISITIEEPKWILYKAITQPNNLLHFPIKKTITTPKISTTKNFIKPNREFRCYKCQISFVSNDWYATKKGFSARCPSCYCAAWISKSTAKNQDCYGTSLLRAINE